MHDAFNQCFLPVEVLLVLYDSKLCLQIAKDLAHMMQDDDHADDRVMNDGLTNIG